MVWLGLSNARYLLAQGSTGQRYGVVDWPQKNLESFWRYGDHYDDYTVVRKVAADLRQAVPLWSVMLDRQFDMAPDGQV